MFKFVCFNFWKHTKIIQVRLYNLAISKVIQLRIRSGGVGYGWKGQKTGQELAPSYTRRFIIIL